MSRFEKRLNELAQGQATVDSRLTAQRSTAAEAFEAMIAGMATLDQYRILTGWHVRDEIKAWSPTLPLGRARRQLELGPGMRHDWQWMTFLVGDVLAHHPSDPLSNEYQSELRRMDAVWQSKSSDPDERLGAATSRLVIGEGDGLSRRASLWGGRCEKAARTKLCNFGPWRNFGLLNVWHELQKLLEESCLELGLEPVPDDHVRVVPYSVYEHLLWRKFGATAPERTPEPPT